MELVSEDWLNIFKSDVNLTTSRAVCRKNNSSSSALHFFYLKKSSIIDEHLQAELNSMPDNNLT